MQISGVTTTASSASEPAVTNRQPNKANSSPPSSSAATEAASSEAAVYKTASDLQASLAASYSPSVNGTSYIGSVRQEGGTYVASVPAPPGVTATGQSVQAAENNLNIKLDTLA